MEPLFPSLPTKLRELTELPADDDVTEARLTGLTLNGPGMPRQEFARCVLERCTFTGDFDRCAFVDVVFDHCDLSGLRTEGLSMQRVELKGCRLTGTELHRAALRNVMFSDCRASYFNLAESRLNDVRFTDCRLDESYWLAVQWTRLVMTGCDLTRAVIQQMSLRGLDMRTNIVSGWSVGLSELRGLIVTPVQALSLAALLEIDIRD